MSIIIFVNYDSTEAMGESPRKCTLFLCRLCYRKDASLARRLPETKQLKKKTLLKLLLQYQSVVLKPRDGSYGRNILFVKRQGTNAYRIDNEKRLFIPLERNWLINKSRQRFADFLHRTSHKIIVQHAYPVLVAFAYVHNKLGVLSLIIWQS